MKDILLVCLVTTIACASTHHSVAYKKAETTRALANRVLGEADEPFGRHDDEVEDLLIAIDDGYTHAQTLTNPRIAQHWLLIKNDVGKFIAEWRQLEVLQGAYTLERTKTILSELDAIMQEEAAAEPQ